VTVNFRGSAAALPGADASLDLDSGLGLGLAAAYRLAPTWEVELSAVRSGTDVVASSEAMGTFDAGSAKLAVLALTLQHRFFTTGRLRPYLGLGLHHAELSSFDASGTLASSGIASISFDGYTSVAAQLGLGFTLGERFVLDLRVTYADYSTEADLELPDGSTWETLRLDVDPWTIGVGVDFRF
jgi:outer membrane protein